VTGRDRERGDHPVTSRDRAAGLHLSGRAGNKHEANKTNGQTRRLPSVIAEVRAFVYRASILDRPSWHSRSTKRLFSRRDLSLRDSRTKRTCFLTYLPWRLSPFALPAQAKASGRLFKQTGPLALPAQAPLPFDNWNILPEWRPAPRYGPVVNPIGMSRSRVLRQDRPLPARRPPQPVPATRLSGASVTLGSSGSRPCGA
jgi:hypothetical protein